MEPKWVLHLKLSSLSGCGVKRGELERKVAERLWASSS